MTRGVSLSVRASVQVQRALLKASPNMRGFPKASVLLLMLSLAACTSHKPPKPQWQTDAQQCSWHWIEGGSRGLWAETCSLSTGRWSIAWSGQENAFLLQRDKEIRGIAVQPWSIRKETGIYSLSKELIKKGYLEPDAPCVWKRVPMRAAPQTMAFFILAPRAPEALGPTASGEVPEPLCGPYGASTHGVRYFITDTRWPDQAIFVEEGQERPMFDPTSITVRR